MVILSLVLATRGACWVLETNNKHEAAFAIDCAMCLGIICYIVLHGK